MLLKNLHHHFVPHIHEDGQQHHPHVLTHIGLLLYLQIFLVFAAGLYLIKIKAPDILGTASFSAEQIVALTNQKRVQNGVGALTINSQLSSAAGAKAANMLSENYWAHNSPSGKTPWTFISAAGYRYLYAGENLARDFSDAGSVVDAWMNSPSHRSNLLDPNFREIGVFVTLGDLTGREGTLVVQFFGSALSQVPAQSNLTQASPSPNPTPSPSASPGQVAKSQGKETKNPNPSATPIVTPSPEVTASPGPVIAIAESPVSPQIPSSATVLASRRFEVGKMASLGLVSLVFLMFALEVVITVKRNHLVLRSGVLAHLALLAFLLFALWYAVGGAIL